jgi:hypothetical protein
MGKSASLRLGAWGVDFWLMGAVLGKLGLEHLGLTRMPKRWMEEVDGYEVSFRKGLEDAESVVWDDVSDELVMLRQGCEETFDRWVGNRIGAEGLKEVLGAIGRRADRRGVDALNREELMGLLGEMDSDRKDAEDVMAKRVKSEVLAVAGAGEGANGGEEEYRQQGAAAGTEPSGAAAGTEPGGRDEGEGLSGGMNGREEGEGLLGGMKERDEGGARIWMVFVRAWDRVIGCRMAVGPDLVGQGDLVKIRVRRWAGEFFARDGLIQVRETLGGWEFMGPYFKERVSHARWSAAKRREWRRRVEDEIGARQASPLLDDSGAQ